MVSKKYNTFCIDNLNYENRLGLVLYNKYIRSRLKLSIEPGYHEFCSKLTRKNLADYSEDFLA